MRPVLPAPCLVPQPVGAMQCRLRAVARALTRAAEHPLRQKARPEATEMPVTAERSVGRRLWP